MQNLFAKLTALVLIGGGFAATGDLGWIAERGMRVLDTAEVAMPTARDEATPPPGVGGEFAVSRSPAVPADPRPQPGAAAGSNASGAVVSAAPVQFKPPAGGPRQIAWSGLAAGDRIVVWLAAGETRCLVLDLVDPTTGEALAYRVAAVSTEGRPLSADGPPCRVVVGRRPGEAGLTVGGMLNLASGGIAAQGDGGRWLGPIEALTIGD